ncbi:hypothetical protein GCM10018793_03690 [Streptomyces sulfonofaciens]|uniref:Uncharacterized protein n=1 Tax=Streptomyces sulfonofaciens TaxID=68272 RepID=A0A919FQI2_9ACTN|nr:hypothetical protein [Streptomyces sulfonofaciens]GHH70126.1 hypothetical protein GCM10018793_03690 [Streptomyces sulfonofaciens]
MNDPSASQRRIVAGARNAARILAFGGLLAVAVVLTRLLAGGRSLQVAAVSVQVERMWIVFAALTVAHAFTAWFLAAHIEEYLDRMPSAERAGWVFDEITTGGNAFVHGLVSRAVPRRRPGFVHRMSRRDPSAWVARGAGVLLVLAVAPWWWGKTGLRFGGSGWLVALALVLTVVNWWAGGRWLIGLSRLEAVRDEDGVRDEDDVQDAAASRAPGSFMGREISALLEPRSGATVDRAHLRWIIGIYRRLTDHPLPIDGTPAPPPGSGHGFDGAPESPVASLTDFQRAVIGINYLAVRDSFPEGDLPADPWFLTDGERSLYRNSSPPHRRVRVRSRRPRWSEISQ